MPKALSMQKKTSELEKDRTFPTLFSQKGWKTPKLGLAVVRAHAKKSPGVNFAKTSDLKLPTSDPPPPQLKKGLTIIARE